MNNYTFIEPIHSICLMTLLGQSCLNLSINFKVNALCLKCNSYIYISFRVLIIHFKDFIYFFLWFTKVSNLLCFSFAMWAHIGESKPNPNLRKTHSTTDNDKTTIRTPNKDKQVEPMVFGYSCSTLSMKYVWFWNPGLDA